MFKKIAAAVAAALFAVSSWAAVDANKGTAAEFDGLKGVGPAMSKRIVDARAQGEFKDWGDFMSRVKGVKDKTAAKLSSEGLTINGQAFTPMAKADGKKKNGKDATAAAAAASTPASTAAPAAAAAPAPAAATGPAPAAKPAVVPAVAPAAATAASSATAATTAATTATTAATAAAAPAAKAAAGK